MKSAVIVDSSCDLPKAFMDKYNIYSTPVKVSIDGVDFYDNRDTTQLLKFYNQNLIGKEHQVETQAPSSQAFLQIIKEKIIPNFEFAYVETVNRLRSPTFDNATLATTKLQDEMPLKLLDSRTVFSGQGLLAAETVRLMRKNKDPRALRQYLVELSAKVHAYTVPYDLYYLRERAKKKGDNSVSFLSAMLGSAFDIHPIVLGLDDKTFTVTKPRGFENAVAQLFKHCAFRISQQKLLSPIVVISYAGDPETICKMKGFEQLQKTADEFHIKIITSIMGLSGGVNVGPGTLSLAMATQPHKWQVG